MLANVVYIVNSYASTYSFLHTRVHTYDGWRGEDQADRKKNWAQRLADDLRVFQATEGSTVSSRLLFGVETVLRPRAARKSGQWYRVIDEATDSLTER